MRTDTTAEKVEVLAAIALLALAAAMELSHDLTGRAWPGYTYAVNGFGLGYLVVWVAGAVWLLMHGFRRPLLPILAFVLTFVHGVMIRLAPDWRGFVVMGAGVAGVAIMLWGRHGVVERRRRAAHP